MNRLELVKVLYERWSSELAKDACSFLHLRCNDDTWLGVADAAISALQPLQDQPVPAAGSGIFKTELVTAYNAGIAAAALKAQQWGDECAGGSGDQIIKTGPSAGQRYGEGYYNLSNAIAALRARDGGGK